MPELAQFLTFAHELADEARRIVLQSLALAQNFDTKSDSSPVTAVDQAVERALRERIMCRFPGHGILGEEYDPENLEADYVWVIDPIDGTKAFITGMPIYGTLISLTRNGFPVLGIIEHPVTAERWAGLEGQQSTYNGTPVQCRPCPQLADAIVSIGNPESLSGPEEAAFKALRRQTKWGIYGGNCYVYGRLAMGRVDISLDGGLEAFDFCALDAVVRGAGGCMTDWNGQRLSLRSGPNVAAVGDPELHKRVIEVLRGG